MRRKSPTPKYLPPLIGGAVLLLVIILLATRLGGSDKSAQAETAAEISDGVAYLTGLEAKNPDDVDQVLKEQRAQRLQEMRDERLRQLESGEISVWSLFEDYALLGDSRAVGFSFYGFLPEDRVFAESGARIEDIETYLPNLKDLNPANIFLCYGLNDVGMYATGEDYAARYREIIDELHAALPEANIYISSILPAYAASLQQYDVSGFNAAVKTMCDTTDRCYYVDNDATAAQYSDLWEPDQIHVQQEFYPHWAANLITEVYSVGLSAEP